MKILVVEPYCGGSHERFVRDLVSRLPFDFDVLELPARAWKWRMRTAAMHFAGRAGAERYDAVVASGMINVAELRGLTPSLARTPISIYWHENQLAYPSRKPDERDVHFALTNAVSALAANRNLFNSRFNLESLLAGLDTLLAMAPDVSLGHVTDGIRAKSRVLPVPLDTDSEPSCTAARPPGPLRVLWNHRWEHDKNPGRFFDVLIDLARTGAEFEVAVLGQAFRDVPDDFERGREALGERIVAWGFVESREAYLAELRRCHVVVSTADQEFQGLSLLEAALQGAFPLAPRRLVYPEILPGECLWDDPSDLMGRLVTFAKTPPAVDEDLVGSLDRFSWTALEAEFSAEIAALCVNRGPPDDR